MRRARGAVLLTVLCVLAASPAGAQGARPDARPAQAAKKSAAPRKVEARKKVERPKEDPQKTEAPAPPPDAARPYDPQLARLAEIVGALAFLRDLCKAGDGDDWRDRMTALLDADAPNGARRQKLIGAFNRGFRGFELTYRACTPNAEAAVSRYLAEADHITNDIAYRFGAQ